MSRFEKIKQYKDININLPQRKTKYSAGYDFEVAEDIVVPSYAEIMPSTFDEKEPLTLEEVAKFTKSTKIKPTLVPTGVKCAMADDEFLQLSIRSSAPLKSWLILANGVGIIDADYYDNPDNEGHIFFQIINLSPFAIQLKKGDIIGQGIIMKYNTVENDSPGGERSGGFGSTTK